MLLTEAERATAPAPVLASIKESLRMLWEDTVAVPIPSTTGDPILVYLLIKLMKGFVHSPYLFERTLCDHQEHEILFVMKRASDESYLGLIYCMDLGLCIQFVLHARTHVMRVMEAASGVRSL